MNMTLNFYKYQGTGNDFVMIDNRKEKFDPNDNDLVKFLCDRRFGIGADGLILLEEHRNYDFQMIYFNADGNQSSMCGNGGRCIVQFAHDMRVIDNKASFIAVDGEHDAFIKDNLVHLKMIEVEDVENLNEDFFLNTGSPHYVRFEKDVQALDVFEEGRKVRYNDRFKKEGTNVNFVQKESEDTLRVRTYERGVEDETFSCGTGVTAAALAASFRDVKSPVKIKTLGGDLGISFEKSDGKFKNIYLIGPAVQVFRGTIEL